MISSGGGGGISYFDQWKRRWRLKRGNQKFKSTSRIESVRPSWIAPQIGPIGFRCIDETGVTPDNSLAPGRDDGAYPLSHRVIGIGSKEIQVTWQRVAVQRLEVGLLRVQFTDRPCA